MYPGLKYLLGLFILSVVLCSSLYSQQPVRSFRLQLIDSGFIFSKAPFESCHASSLVELKNGKIMAVWFGGKQEGSDDVGIWMSFYQNKNWNSPAEIANGKQANGKRFACWNPVLFQNKNGLLFLFYKVGSSPRTWWAEMKTSVDNGRHWSVAKKLPAGFLGPIRTKPIQLSNGDILYPSSTESEVGNKWTIHLEHTDSNGNNWRKISIDCDSFSVIQPCILQYGRDTIQLLCRSRQNVIAESWSYNGGTTWSPVQATHLLNPNSGIDAISLQNKMKLLVYNPLPSGKDWWNGRSVLSIAQSSDGRDWQQTVILEKHHDGEYSYPAIIQSKNGIIYVSYTYQRKYIKYAILKSTQAF